MNSRIVDYNRFISPLAEKYVKRMSEFDYGWILDIFVAELENKTTSFREDKFAFSSIYTSIDAKPN